MDLSQSAILTESGHFVSEKWARLNEILQDYDPYLELHWIPTDKRAVGNEAPYRIIHNPPNNPAYVVTHAKETDDPVTIFASIIGGDNWKNNVLAKLEAQNAAQEIFDKKKQLDELEESADLAHYLLVRGGNYVTIRDSKSGELVKLDSQRNRISRIRRTM